MMVEMCGAWLGTHPAMSDMPSWALHELLAAYELMKEDDLATPGT